jgi:mono/diheme cytochrome c family protein
MKIWTGVGFIALVLLSFAAACSKPDQGGGIGAARNVSADDPLERGRKAYFKHCVACHSPDTDEYVAGIALKGYFNNPPTELSDGTVFSRTDEAIRQLIEDGTQNMPPLMKGITPKELDDILSYMHTL